jgi:hypothetical protein
VPLPQVGTASAVSDLNIRNFEDFFIFLDKEAIRKTIPSGLVY